MKKHTLLMILLSLFASLVGKSQTITAYEYWFDYDYDNRVYVSIAGGTVDHIDTDISTTSISTGYHMFWFHTKSSDGKWSVPVSSSFVKGNNAIIGIEWWYDDDYTTRVYMDLTPSQGGAYPLALPVSGLSIGNHNITMCFVDNEQVRSAPVSSTFYYDGISGLENTAFNDGLKLFPNPVQSQLQITGITQSSQLVIYDQVGKTVLNRALNNPTESLNIEQLQPGTYTALVLSQTKCSTMTFVKD